MITDERSKAKQLNAGACKGLACSDQHCRDGICRPAFQSIHCSYVFIGTLQACYHRLQYKLHTHLSGTACPVLEFVAGGQIRQRKL